MKVKDIASGRSGDKGPVLDLTLVARDETGYERLLTHVTEKRVRSAFGDLAPGPVVRYELPRLNALKFVLPEALAGGVYLSSHPGLHWQKGAIHVLVDMELP
jgi:hypothetical protein